jgi:hypothetical protein
MTLSLTAGRSIQVEMTEGGSEQHEESVLVQSCAEIDKSGNEEKKEKRTGQEEDTEGKEERGKDGRERGDKFTFIRECEGFLINDVDDDDDEPFQLNSSEKDCAQNQPGYPRGKDPRRVLTHDETVDDAKDVGAGPHVEQNAIKNRSGGVRQEFDKRVSLALFVLD